MSDVKLKPVVTYRLSGEKETATRTLLKTRDLIDMSDEPLERNGTNEGFAPTEFCLGGLAACTNVISHKIAKQMGIEIHDMSIDLVAKFNRLGVNLADEVDVVFPEIEMTVNVTTEASEEEIEQLAEDLRKYCAVSRLFRHAGTDIKENWQVNKP